MQFNSEARQDLYKSFLMKFKSEGSQEEWRQQEGGDKEFL